LAGGSKSIPPKKRVKRALDAEPVGVWVPAPEQFFAEILSQNTKTVHQGYTVDARELYEAGTIQIQARISQTVPLTAEQLRQKQANVKSFGRVRRWVVRLHLSASHFLCRHILFHYSHLAAAATTCVLFKHSTGCCSGVASTMKYLACLACCLSVAFHCPLSWVWASAIKWALQHIRVPGNGTAALNAHRDIQGVPYF